MNTNLQFLPKRYNFISSYILEIMVVEESTNFEFIQFWHGAKARPSHFLGLTVVGHVYRVLINYFYRRVKMRISRGSNCAVV